MSSASRGSLSHAQHVRKSVDSRVGTFGPPPNEESCLLLRVGCFLRGRGLFDHNFPGSPPAYRQALFLERSNATGEIGQRKVRMKMVSIPGQAVSGDVLRFIDNGMKGKSVPRP